VPVVAPDRCAARDECTCSATWSWRATISLSAVADTQTPVRTNGESARRKLPDAGKTYSRPRVQRAAARAARGAPCRRQPDLLQQRFMPTARWCRDDTDVRTSRRWQRLLLLGDIAVKLRELSLEQVTGVAAGRPSSHGADQDPHRRSRPTRAAHARTGPAPLRRARLRPADGHADPNLYTVGPTTGSLVGTVGVRVDSAAA